VGQFDPLPKLARVVRGIGLVDPGGPARRILDESPAPCQRSAVRRLRPWEDFSLVFLEGLEPLGDVAGVLENVGGDAATVLKVTGAGQAL